MTKPPQDFSLIQNRFANALREGRQDPLFANIETRRLDVYQSLFFNNISSLLARGFPVIRKILGEAEWKQQLRRFYQQHRCQTPLFPKIGGEFVAWLSACPVEQLPYAFLPELAHYEYMEVLVDTADCVVPERREQDEDALLDRPGTRLALNPTAVLLQYRYPVHRLSPDYLPAEPPAAASNLLVYRRHDHETRFMALSLANAMVLSRLEAEAAGFDALCAALSSSGLDLEDEQLRLSLRQQLIELLGKEVLFIQPTAGEAR